MKKPYKSLTDVYINSRAIVNENVEIVGIPEDGSQERLGSIPTDYYKQLKRLVLSKADGGVESLVKQLLRLGEWEEVADIDTIVLEIFLGYDVDVQVLNQIVEKKKSGTLGKLESYINKNGIWNLIEAVDPLTSKLTKNFSKMFQELTYKVQPKIATVSVGPGEISLSMFTNAVKGNVGDLMLGETELEIKGDGGRLGSSDYTKGIFTTPGNKYLQYLSGRGNDQHFSQAETPLLRNQLAIKSKATRKNLNTIRKDLAKHHADTQNVTDGILNQLDKSLEILEDTKTVIDAETLTQNIQNAYDQLKSRSPLPLHDKMTFVKNMNTLMSSLSKLLNSTTERNDYNWQDSAQYMFNHDWGMTPREMAETFVEMRTELLDQGQVASLISALESIFKKQDVRKDIVNIKKQVSRGKSLAQTTLQRLQASLQATSYQLVHGFERIIALNSKTLNACSLKFDNNDDAGQKLLNTYKQFINTPNLVVTNAGVDQRNKGIGIGVKA